MSRNNIPVDQYYGYQQDVQETDVPKIDIMDIEDVHKLDVAVLDSVDMSGTSMCRIMWMSLRTCLWTFNACP